NHSFYTGYTNNLERRYQQHATGTGGCKYTKAFKPIKIVHAWKINSTKSTALKIERQIKKQNRTQKIALITNPDLFYDLFAAFLE
ncbi:GIY-YIG nuclease family protein, partial [Acinetobacter baumannii]